MYRPAESLAMILLSLFFLGSVFGADDDTNCDVTWNVEERWGITYQGLNLALDEAQALLFIQSASRVCLYLAPGLQESKVPDFKVGQLIGVKSKCCGDGHWT